MTSREFCYWLQGLFELGDPKALDEKQTDLVKRHLSMAFVHEIDPSYPEKEKLDAAHRPEPFKPGASLGPLPSGLVARC